MIVNYIRLIAELIKGGKTEDEALALVSSAYSVELDVLRRMYDNHISK